jgi:biopolymer transport protein TolQ
VLSWAVIGGRYRYLKRAESASVRLQREIALALRLSQLNEIAGRYPASPLSAIMQAGFREMISAVNEGLAGQRAGTITPEQARERVLLRVRRRAEESASIEADALDRNLGLLATTGTVTPFIGLFGTVWGIMDAFQGIGMAGSASLAAVAPGISEALVATAAGLAAAIPAVVGYNLLLARARRLGARIDRFVPQFMTMAEVQMEAGRPTSAPLEAGTFRS